MDLIHDADLQLSADELLATYDVNTREETVKVPFVGLNNLGNTCFFNSIIQMLYYCPGFRKHLDYAAKNVKKMLADEPAECSMQMSSESKDKCNLLVELDKLYVTMNNHQLFLLDTSCEPSGGKNFSAVRPENLLDILRKVYPAFEPYAQQDAQECLRCVLSLLQDAISVVRGKARKELSVGDAQKSGCKVLGGRKLDAASQSSTSTERVQIENRDPNRQSVKQEPRSATARKRNLRLSLRKPLKLKRSTDIPGNQLPNDVGIHRNCPVTRSEINSKETKSKSKVDQNLPLAARGTPNSIVKDAGCFAKFKRTKNSGKQKRISPTSGIKHTPTKRPNPDENPPASPPFKRKRLTLSNGIRNFYKPIASSIVKPKSLLMPDTKQTYQVMKSEKKNKTNPFKVVLKPKDAAPKYRLLCENPAIPPENDSLLRNTSQTLSQELSEKNNSFILGSAAKAEKTVEISSGNGFNPSTPDFIEDLFQGQLVNQMRCMECENSIQRNEAFMDISLPVKEDSDSNPTTLCGNKEQVVLMKHCSVQWGLSEFTSHEILEGENKYYCEQCRRYVEGERRLQFASLPPILTLHLKRFTTSKPVAGGDAFCSTVSKINSSLNVPLHISLTTWCSATCDNRMSNYVLFGVVIHSGIAISSGHYLSYVRLEESSTDKVDERLAPYKDCWLEADDERTRLLSQDEFLGLLFPQSTEGVARTPYLLFYRREEE